MPRHPPDALKALDHSHYRCPSFSLRAEGSKALPPVGYLSAFACAARSLVNVCKNIRRVSCSSSRSTSRRIRRSDGSIDKERPVSRDMFAFPAVAAGKGRDQAKKPDVGERPQPRPHDLSVPAARHALAWMHRMPKPWANKSSLHDVI